MAKPLGSKESRLFNSIDECIKRPARLTFSDSPSTGPAPQLARIFARILNRPLAHSMSGKAVDPDAFSDGLDRARQAGGVLHHAFGVRTRVLRGDMTEAAAYGYLSGLLIGHELNAAFDGSAQPVAVVGADSLARLYADAITARGGNAKIVGEAVAAAGLARLGRSIGWV